jgi:hypothetical protein
LSIPFGRITPSRLQLEIKQKNRMKTFCSGRVNFLMQSNTGMEEAVNRPGLLRNGQSRCRLFKPGIVPWDLSLSGLSIFTFTIQAISNFGSPPENVINASRFLHGFVSMLSW